MPCRAFVCAPAAITLAVFAPHLCAQTAVSWDNSEGGVWSDAMNWDPETVPNNGMPPGSTYFVTIDLAGTYMVTLDQAFTVTNLTFNNANATLTSSGVGDFTSVGTVTYTSGTLRGIAQFSVNNLIFDNVAQIDVDDVCIDLAGLAEWTGMGNIALDNGADIQNRLGATFRITNNQQIFDTGGGIQPFMVNAGTFEKIGGGGLSEIVGVLFTNTGTVRVNNGTLRLTDLTNYNSVTQTLTGGIYDLSSNLRFDGADIVTLDASVTLDGLGSSITNEAGESALRNLDTIASGGTLALLAGRDLTTPGALTHEGLIRLGAAAGNQSILEVGSSLTQSAGVVNLEGGRVKVTSVYTLASGSLVGSGDIEGDFVTSGTVAVGASAGQINFGNNFTQLPGGHVEIEIGGPIPGLDHDFISIQGLLQFEGMLAGTLDIQLIRGFRPRIGQVYQIIQYGQVQGQFEQILGLNLGGGLFFVPEYTQNSLNLFVVPSSGVIAPLGLAALFAARRRRRSV